MSPADLSLSCAGMNSVLSVRRQLRSPAEIDEALDGGRPIRFVLCLEGGCDEVVERAVTRARRAAREAERAARKAEKDGAAQRGDDEVREDSGEDSGEGVRGGGLEGGRGPTLRPWTAL